MDVYAQCARRRAARCADDRARPEKRPLRVCVDILVTVSGFLLGGQFGIGTVISALGLGSLINLNFSLLHFRPAEVHQENIAETLRYLRS